jgi:tryptophan 2,3-dioxygenase
MAASHKQVYYSDYLQLERLLDAQQLESTAVGPAAHDEMLFIITHQAYELWFKQILHELKSVVQVFGSYPVDEKQMGVVLGRLERIRCIQQVLLQQIDIIETMTPLDFLDFRDLLVPASGFQSIQFKQIEITLGLKKKHRSPADQDFFVTRLRPEHRDILEALEEQPSLLELTDDWLARMPFLYFQDFDFWTEYSQAVADMLASDRTIIESNPMLSDREREFQLSELAATEGRLASLLDAAEYDAQIERGERRLSQNATLAALFIHLYRDEPILYGPFRYLTRLVEIDELFTAWRTRHAVMVQRMLGTKIGTGGSSGHDYLSRTTQQNRVFIDLFALSTYLIPRSSLPRLPDELHQSLGFFFSGTSDAERELSIDSERREKSE